MSAPVSAFVAVLRNHAEIVLARANRERPRSAVLPASMPTAAMFPNEFCGLVAASTVPHVNSTHAARRLRGHNTPSDADFAALGQLGLIARSSVFDRLRLGRGEALAEPLGAACSIKRGLGVALEPRHHLARDQFVTA